MKNQNNKIIILFLGLVLWIGTEITLSQQLQVHPVRIGKGPLLFFYHPENSQGISTPGSESGRMEVLYVYDPTSEKPPQRMWHSGHAQLHPLSRLDPNVVLFEHKDRLYIVDLTQGKANSILPNELYTELITVKGSIVYFLERRIPYWKGEFKLKIDESGKRVITSHYTPRAYICVLDSSTTDKPKRITELEVERVLKVDEQCFWVVTAGENRKLCRIQMDGKFEEIIPFDSHWVTSLTDIKFSPNRKYIAISLYHDQYDLLEERKLVVIDLEKKKTAFVRERIYVVVPPEIIGSSVPKVFFEWIDDTYLHYFSSTTDSSEDVYVNVENGTILEKKKWLELKSTILWLCSIIVEQYQKKGYFHHIDGLLYFKGESTPVASVLNKQGRKASEFFICPQGEWAAFVSPEDKSIYIVDGKKKEKSLIITRWNYDLKWLPSIK
ncbi:hypothetical protein ACFL02_06790 [Planctomycetota bacterium]